MITHKRGISLAGALLLAVAAGVGTATPANAATQDIYSPDLDTYPNDSVSSPRAILLQHQSDESKNGQMLASFDHYYKFPSPKTGRPNDSFPIYRSTDRGNTWEPNPAKVADAEHQSSLKVQPMLLELPQQVGDLAEGTLLLAGNFGQDLQVYTSTDSGETWKPRSSCAKGNKSGNIWEPFLTVDDNGDLNCYFSDEREPGTYDQFLGHVTSTDAGKTWGKEVKDVAIPDGASRPGMASIAKTADGKWVMAYEIMGGSYHGQIHTRTSADGTTWGDASDPGTLVTAGGHYLAYGPDLSAIPPTPEYPRGALVLYADGYHTTSGAGEPADTLFINANNGSGTWDTAPAPFTPGSGTCVNYKPALAWTGTSMLQLSPTLKAAGTNEETDPDHCKLTAGVADIHADPNFTTWAGVNVRADAHTTSKVVTTLDSATHVYVECQKQGDTVSYGNNSPTNWWGKLRDQNGYISAMFIDQPNTKLANVPDC